MKIITTVIIIVLCSAGLYAQQPAGADSAVAMPSPVAPAKGTSSLSNYGLSVELTTNWLSPLPTGVNNDYIGGLGLAVNVQRKIFLVKKNFYFSFGLGIATYDYATNAEIEHTTHPNIPDTSYFSPIPKSVTYSKNKLNLVWLQIPVEFTLQTNANAKGQSFNFTLGARFGYLINDHTKQKGTDSTGATYKIKIYEIPNLEQFSTIITAKIGYGHLDLFGYYNLSTLFEGNSEATNELGAGIALTF